MTRILGIESSCDETAAAVVDDRHHVRSSVIASQVDVHRAFGGVVPELAARQHVEAIGPVVRAALDEADAGFDSLDAVAVTQGPGLIGSLLVGVCAAKAIAWRHELPLLAVNHLEGHIRSAFIDHPEIEFPALALIVSGGHTSLYLCPEESDYRVIARTRDDAAGEAFDKVAKLLGLGYPGGPVIEKLARGADASSHAFPHAQMKDGSLDFSFSGLKTAVRRLATERGLAHHEPTGGDVSDEVRDLVAAFQRAVVRVLVRRSLAACKRERVKSLLLTGGVACNKSLRDAFAHACDRAGVTLYAAAPRYTTDNAAMIAAAAFLHYEKGAFAPLDINAHSNFPL
ncbi:MAG: tRNA (adenosine(37)-N6)-threonylcarbamoyltransferase complex transferase subunit TsaD [Acidobacteria bacterium]|nr:tRNA (adenosine(37)-N6)-threonylcarbamoyltransferase complex transferase subunit TsaD [Acidobacteriota bacterium]NIM64310.1 tRNA (adenosine(37)-N6)-threonylcarbamoyltransferase complex transferase subunit TsaD [Acidobacteriota bacterium]NIQ84953.1 tRNA (adenosine(37)-N6)-threonylcarbamoyltransferase complex transferase subunit TsaD [Acidobacteriota bacterium]NIT10767.1 tRNA (adenosine(37)-N6)-threonylcarbamoyltransferase complex transferase subunit TsaD [Acidobacteriota bacterium]